MIGKNDFHTLAVGYMAADNPSALAYTYVKFIELF